VSLKDVSIPARAYQILKFMEGREVMERDNLGFNKVDAQLVPRLKDLIGRDNVLAEVFDTLPYARDNCPYKWSEKFNFRPDVVVIPENTEQVADIVKLANEEKIPITPKGGGTGMMGGCVPKYGGISLDMRKMDKILEVNEENLYVVVQPGITNLRLSDELADLGYLGSHDPGSAPSSVIGGSLSTSAVNYRQGVNGALIDEVIGLQVVLATGEVIRAGRNSGSTRLSKSSVGFDLCHLFVGDYGTLGVKTEATLKIIPLPEVDEIHVVVFPSFENTMKAVQEIQRTRLPGIFTYTVFDREYMLKAKHIYGVGEVYGGAVLIGFMGDAYIVDYVRGKAEQIWRKFGGEDLGPEEAAAEWANRHDVYPTMIATGKPAARWHYEDPTVNVSKMAEALKRYHEIVAKYGFDDWGGEGWIYDPVCSLSAIMYAVDETDEANWDRYMACANEIVKAGLEMGGSISNCLGFDKRGVGRHSLELLKTEYTPSELKTLLSIKKCLDPNGIMNPGIMGLDALEKEIVV